MEQVLICLGQRKKLKQNDLTQKQKELILLGRIILRGEEENIPRYVKRAFNADASKEEIMKILEFAVGNSRLIKSITVLLKSINYEENNRLEYISLSDDLGEYNGNYTNQKPVNREKHNLEMAIITGFNIKLRIKEAIDMGFTKKHILKIAHDLLELYELRDRFYGPNNRNPVKPSPEDIKMNIEERLKKFLESKELLNYMIKLNIVEN